MPPTIPPPDADELAVSPYGIRYPKPAKKAYKLSEMFQRIAEDVSAALQNFGLPPVVSTQIVTANSAAARDAHWGSPATASARRALQDLGAITTRLDLGYSEQYFAGLTDGGANPGGRTTPGWYRVFPSILPSVALRKSANQALTIATNTAVSWDVELVDGSAMHDNVTNNTRIYAPEAGTYEVAANLYINATTGFTLVTGRLNGSSDIAASSTRRDATATTGTPLLLIFPVVLAAGDYIEIQVNCSVSGAVVAGGTTNLTSAVSMKRIA